MSDALTTIRLTQRQDYQFDTRFGDTVPDLVADEPAPLGHGLGPSPVQLLCAAVGNCLSASLLFSMRSTSSRPNRCRAKSRPKWGATPRTGCVCSA